MFKFDIIELKLIIPSHPPTPHPSSQTPPESTSHKLKPVGGDICLAGLRGQGSCRCKHRVADSRRKEGHGHRGFRCG